MAEFLRNRSFENGLYDGSTGVVPREWNEHHTEGEEVEAGQPTLKPETSIVTPQTLPPHEHPLYLKHGDQALHLFKANAPIHAALRQGGLELEPGEVYRMSVYVFVDVIHEYDDDGKKVPPPPGSYAAMVRLLTGSGADPLGGSNWRAHDWYSEGEIDDFYLNGHYLTWTFEARDGEDAVALEFLCKWGQAVNGFFIDDLSLIGSEYVPPEPPEPEPEPHPVEYDWTERGSRLGVHAILNNDNKVVEMARKMADAGAPFPVVKVVDDLRYLEELKEASPDTKVVLRFTSGIEGCPDVHNLDDAELDRLAEDLLGRVLDKATLAELAMAEWIEISNEPDPPSADGYRKLGVLMVKCIALAEQQGLKLAVLGLNNGTPEWDEMLALVESGMFRKAYDGGHIISVHEGVWWPDKEMDEGFGTGIPGAPYMADGGSLCFRYRYLYLAAKLAGEPWPPLIISEWYADRHDGPAADVMNRSDWYDQEGAADYYLLAYCPFTMGGKNAGWGDEDYDFAYDALTDRAITRRDRQNAAPPGPAEPGTPEPPEEPAEPPAETPTVDYEVTVHVPAQSLASYDGVHAVARESFGTIAPSIDDAGHLTNVICPSGDGGHAILYDVRDRQRFIEHFAANFPLARLSFASTSDHVWDRDISGELATNDDCPAPLENGWWRRTLEQIEGLTVHHTLSHSPHATASYYVSKGGGRPSIPYHLWIAETGEVLKCLDFTEGCWHDHTGHHNRNLSVGLAGNLLERPPSDAQMGAAASVAAWAVWNPEMRVELSRVLGHQDHATTACPGWHSGWRAEFYERLRRMLGLHDDVAVGMHDEAGGRWMVEQGMVGPCLVNAQVKTQPVQLDYRHLSDAGVTVICRLNWGYAQGDGTVPPPQQADAWIAALVATIQGAQGVERFVIGNELNNPSEWPGGYPNPTYAPTPAYYVDLYNRVAGAVSAKLSPFAIDPFNAVAGEFGCPADPKAWADQVYEGIDGLDFISLHAKTQTNDPGECWSEAEFSDAPLIGRKLHLRTVEDQIAWVPPRFDGVPVYVTELNPQRQQAGSDAVGWASSNAEWVQQALAYVRTQPVRGVVFYRYDEVDPWGLASLPVILEAIAGAA